MSSPGRWFSAGTIDRSVELIERPRVAEGILAVAMLLSGALVLWFGRGTTFSGDEMVFIVASPGIDLHTAFQAHGGHLLVFPRAVYKVMLELFGLAYLPYRVLTLLTIWLTVGLLFVWMARRVGRVVALAPCLVLLVFGSDHLHVLLGNGFIILLSIACGIAALMALERGDRRGDIAAAALLTLGAATYTVTLPFVVGAGALILLSQGRWRRIWVVLVPLALYGAWRIWLMSSGGASGDSELRPANIALIPSWIFESIGSVMAALSGLAYDFSGAAETAVTSPTVGTLALAVIIVIAWWLSRNGAGRGFYVVALIGLALWSIQCLVAIPGAFGLRLPGDPRYLYPGAVVTLMILAEALRGARWNSTAVVAIFVVAISGVGTNLALLRDNGATYRLQANSFKEEVGIGSIFAREGYAVPLETRTTPVIAKDAGTVIFSMALQPYGRFGDSVAELKAKPPDRRVDFDRQIAAQFGLTLEPAASATDCSTVVASESGPVLVPGISGPVVLRAPGSGGEIKLARFGDTATVELGELPAGDSRLLDLPEDRSSIPWRLDFDGSKLEVCRPE